MVSLAAGDDHLIRIGHAHDVGRRERDPMSATAIEQQLLYATDEVPAQVQALARSGEPQRIDAAATKDLVVVLVIDDRVIAAGGIEEVAAVAPRDSVIATAGNNLVGAVGAGEFIIAADSCR